MPFLIVGAGISGLYAAYSLHKKFGIKDIIVIESSNRIGGRIASKKIADDVFIEMGAGGVESVHENVINLAKELGLGDKISKGSSGRSYAEIETIDLPRAEFETVPSIYHIKNLVEIDKSDFYPIMTDLKNRLTNPKFYSWAKDYSLYRLIEKLYGSTKADQLMHQHGYHSDFIDCNSIDGVEMFHYSFGENSKYSRFVGGMSQLISGLAAYLEKNSIPIYLEKELEDIEVDKNTYRCLIKNKNPIYADNIILTLPKVNMLKIKYLEKINDKLEGVVNKELCRVYAFFPLENGKVWFDDFKSTITTRTVMSQIIPYDKKNGILMIYCDDSNARQWHYLHENKILERELQYNLLKLFSDRTIPKPIRIEFSFNPSATHLWKPGRDSVQSHRDIIHPIPGENIFIVGETYSLVQGWSEGAIRSVNELMEIIGQNKIPN